MSDLQELRDTLTAACAEMERRSEDAARRRLRGWDGETLTLVVDECRTALGEYDVNQAVERLVVVGRKAGVRVELSDTEPLWRFWRVVRSSILRDAIIVDLMGTVGRVVYIQKFDDGGCPPIPTPPDLEWLRDNNLEELLAANGTTIREG